MLRWVCQQSPKSQTISQVFDSPMFIIKAVIEMTPEEEQLKIASGELFENFRSSTIIQSKNGGSKRVREVVNDEDELKKSKKQKSKIKMKKAIRNLQDRVAVVEGQLNTIKSDIDELKGLMSTILKHIGLQRKGDEGDHKVSEGLEDEHIEVKKKGDEDVLEKKVDIGLEEPIDVVDDEDVIEIEPFLTQRPHVRPARRKRASVYLSTPFTTLPKRSRHQPPKTSRVQAIVYDPMHKILDVHLDRLRAWITHKRMTMSALVDYVVGSKVDFQDPWASVDYVYSPFNVHGNHWVLLCLDLVSCEVKVWDSLPSLTTAEEMTNILLPIRQLVPKLLDSTGFFDRRGRSSTYKEPWPVVIVDPIPLQRNNCDCGVFAIKYFEYIAAGVGLDTLCQENMSYFRKQLAFQVWTNTPMY
ncbi:hypothetical protein IC575_016607 [Cucumis melo]